MVWYLWFTNQVAGSSCEGMALHHSTGHLDFPVGVELKFHLEMNWELLVVEEWSWVEGDGDIDRNRDIGRNVGRGRDMSGNEGMGRGISGSKGRSSKTGWFHC